MLQFYIQRRTCVPESLSASFKYRNYSHKRLFPSLVMLYVYSGNRMWRTEMRARRRVQRKENVSEVSEGKLSHRGNVFTHTLFDYLVRISTDKITHLVCVGS